MTQITKFRLHKYSMLPILILIWTLCIIPFIITYPFKKLADYLGYYMYNRTQRLMKKYDIGIYYNSKLKKTMLLTHQEAESLNNEYKEKK